MIFFVTWFPTFLRETRGVSLLQSGMLTTYAGVAAMLGVVCGGYSSDWLLARTGSKRIARQGLAATGMTVCATLIVASSLVRDVGSAIALISAGAFGAMLFPVTVGWLVSVTGTWNAALFAFAALMAVDAVLWMMLNPRGHYLEAD